MESVSMTEAELHPEEEIVEEIELVQWIYISAATVPFDQSDLTTLLEKAREKNHKVNVSGMLVYHEGSFFQVLEGPAEEVEKVYDIISDDPRHDEVQLLLKHQIEERSFPDWSMGFVNTEKEPLSKLPGFSDFFKRGFSIPEMRKEKSLLGRVMREFREGKWRQRIE